MIACEIDYNKIAKSIAFYTERGFEYIEVPWLVSKESVAITTPSSCNVDAFLTTKGVLVASAEQSFIEMMRAGSGLAPQKRYVACSPCFREDDPNGTKEYHSTHFLKVELFQIASKEQIRIFVAYANLCFTQLGAKNNLLKTVATHGDHSECESFDIEYNGVEVGSYGSRSIEVNGRAISYVYGTGLAEPRFSYVLKKWP